MVHKLGWLVEDYAAAGDGTTNDHAAFQGLVAGMGTWIADTERQVCNLQPKTYSVDSPIVIDTDGICLEGQDPIGSVIKGSAFLGANEPVIDVVANGGNTQLRSVEFNNLTVSRVNSGPLIRFRGVLCATVANCRLENGNPYIMIDKPGSAANLRVMVSQCDCSGGQADVGVDAADVDALLVVTTKLVCAGVGAIGIKVATGQDPVAWNVGFVNCGAAALHLRNTAQFWFVGGLREGAMSRWVDDDTATSGTVIGRTWTNNPPAGTWAMLGPLDD